MTVAEWLNFLSTLGRADLDDRKLVLRAIADYSNPETGRCCANKELLIVASNLSRWKFDQILSALLIDEWISRVPRFIRGNTAGESTWEYAIDVPKVLKVLQHDHAPRSERRRPKKVKNPGAPRGINARFRKDKDQKDRKHEQPARRIDLSKLPRV